MTPQARPTAPSPKPSTYIEGIGWRHATEHSMTRWPRWKDSRKPGTYMLTLKVNDGQKLLGTLQGSTAPVYRWMKENNGAVASASHDPLYYRHALLGTKAMPFIQKPAQSEASQSAASQANNKPSQASNKASQTNTTGVETPVPKDEATPSEASSCGGVSTPSSIAPATGPHGKPRTHFPLEALRQPDAPHIKLSPLGEAVKAAWERMPEVEPLIEPVCLAIMPNHIHAIIAVRSDLSRPIGSVIRSFMGTTTHTLHKMLAEGTIQIPSSCDGVSQPPSSCDGVSTPSEASQRGGVSTPSKKPSLWQPGYCLGVCNTEEKLHTRIGYVLENPFFGIMEKEQPHFMERTTLLTIADRRYRAYGNILLLKEPDRIQVFCHRQHPTTRQPYHLTNDFNIDKTTALDAAANGTVIVTPGISPGESEIMWAVLRAGGNVINIQRELPLNDKWHPDKERRLYCEQGQLLVLAAHDLPDEEFRDRQGNVIPSDTRYSQFHNLNAIAAELCQEGIEHGCKIKAKR